ncbi:MAG: hypothetical protein ABL974_19975 [Prosthecobacter sp.]
MKLLRRRQGHGADQLRKPLWKGNPTFDTAQAIAVMLEKHGIACDLMHGFNWDGWNVE